MRNLLRTLTLLLAVVSLSFLTSCEKDEFDSGSIESNIDHPTFSDLVTYEKDGSFSAKLTGEEMAYILQNEFRAEGNGKSNNHSMSFAQILIDNAPGAIKGIEGQKTTTYGIVTIAMGMGAGGSFLQFEGIGGLASNASLTKSIDVTISQNSFPIAFAFSFVFTSGGFGYPLAYNDSSFDKNSNCVNWRIRSKIAFNGINNATGLAFVSASGPCIAIADPIFELGE